MRLLCPLCGKDKPFRGLFFMRKQCRSCGYVFERERGYFLGSADVNFACTFVLLVPLAVGSFALREIPTRVAFYVCLSFVVGFPVLFFRYSKALYMALDLALDPPVERDFKVRKASESVEKRRGSARRARAS